MQISYVVSTGEFTTDPARFFNTFPVSKQGNWNTHFRF